MGPGREVHISDGPSGEDQACDDLGKVVCGNAISETGVKQGTLYLGQTMLLRNTGGETYKGRDDGSHHQCNYESPDGKGDVLLEDDDKAKHKTDNEYDHIPPPGRFLVVLGHMRVMRVVEPPFFRGLESPDRVATPEEDDVGNESSDLDLIRMNYSQGWIASQYYSRVRCWVGE